jgi:acetyl esterase/lipase
MSTTMSAWVRAFATSALHGIGSHAALLRGVEPDDGFHPDLRAAAALLPRQPISLTTLPVIRALTDLIRLRRPNDVDVVRLGDGVEVRVHRPAGQAAPGSVLLWIHGGGYVLGCAQQDDPLCRRFAAALGVVVAAVDYRLAPEHPHPTSVQDCHTALTWLAAQPGVDPTRLAIGGASAGGGLAAELAVAARDRGDMTPVLQLLVYPMLDDRSSSRTDLDESRFRLWGTRSNRFGWQSYLGSADPDIALPARHGNLAGLAPAWIGVGTLDLFHDEDLAYAKRLTEAGVPCDLEIVPGAFHGFDAIRPAARVSQSFFDAQCDRLRAAFGT